MLDFLSLGTRRSCICYSSIGPDCVRTKRDSGSDAASSSSANGSNTTNATTGAEQKPVLSTRGAFNGSDITVTHRARLSESESLNVEEDNSNILLFYQHYNSEIRWMQYLAPKTWYGGTADQVVATDAKNGTSMDMISSVDSLLELHVYCTCYLPAPKYTTNTSQTSARTIH